jgi:hypothetical protein
MEVWNLEGNVHIDRLKFFGFFQIQVMKNVVIILEEMQKLPF